MRIALLSLVLFFAGFGVSQSFAKSSVRPASVPSVPSTPVTTADQPDCSGGPESHLVVSLVPEAIERSGGRDVLSASTHIGNRGEHEAQVRYTVEIVSDTGRSVFRAPGPTQRLARAGSLPPGLVRTPRSLDDGYYLVRLVADAEGEDGEVQLMDHLYFQVQSGELTLLDANDWYAQSQINVGVAQ